MVQVKDMEWKDAKELVGRRLNRLAMCKRGTLKTEINKRREELGCAPRLTKEERKIIKDNLAAQIAKALTPTIGLVKKYNDTNELAKFLKDRATKVETDAYIHPKYKKWEKDVDNLNDEEKVRMAMIDSDFQDVIDEFTLGTLNISDFPARLLELEEKEW